jgi:hypothetical protein
MKYTPRDYQETALNWLETKEKSALFLDVGLGKSSVALFHMVKKLAFGEVTRWLIVAPLRVCQTTWPSELAKWTFARELTVHNMAGPQKNRAAVSDEALDHQVTIINLENLVKLIRHFGTDWPFDGVILDESSKFKDPSTKRWKAMRHVSKYVTHAMLLTGSPCAQSIMNLWSQVFLIDGGERLGRTKDSFKHRYFRQVDWHGYEWEPIPGAEEKIIDRIGDVCLVMEAQGMPEPVYNPIEVQLDLTTLKKYKELERHFFLEVMEDEGVTAVNAATLTNKLGQVANGFAYWEGDDGERHVEEFHKYKIEALEDYADEHGSPFLLGFHYKHDRDRLLQHFGKRIEIFDGTQDQMDRWGKGAFQILALHPQSGGHGVDGLQHHTCTVVWYSPPWSREQFDQLNGRVTGARQKGTAFEHTQSVVNYLVSRGTIDVMAASVLNNRGTTQKEILAMLREKAASYSMP